ncbi:MAG: DUF4292 domain-containing protein [Cyclobacteriaceae bacterium]|nr:DUF4292 domain-containing protein [Cyclobacteriaceae bacterium]
MRKLAFIICGLTAFLISCSKKVVPVIPPPPASLEIQEIDFEYFHGKARMLFRDDKKERDVKANIRIRKDSVIWMTFSVIGVQGGKALINKDSITIVSTVDKEYYVFNYQELSRRFNFAIDYNTIQSAVLGNLISPRQSTDKIIPGPSFNSLEQQRNTVSIKNYINAASRKLEKVEMKESNTNNAITINYSNFQPVGEKVYPFNGVINIFYKTVSGLLNTTISLEYNKAEVGDKELKFPFNIPRKYERR